MDSVANNKEGDDGNKVSEELKSLNQSFLSSVQEALGSTPDACLAPLALDYLKFAYPLLKKGSDGGGGDYVEGARFFANLKRNISETSSSSANSGSSPVPNKRSANGDLKKKVEEVKPSFPFQQAPGASEEKNKTPGPGFFGLGSSRSPMMGSTSTLTSVSKASGPSATVTTSSTTGFSFGEPTKTGTNSSGGSLFGQSTKTETATSSTFNSNFFKSSSTSSSASFTQPLFGTMTTTTSAMTSQKPGTSLFGSFQPSSSPSGFGFASAPSSTGMFSGFGSAGPGSGAKQADSGPVNSTENNEDDEEEGEPEPPPKPVVEDDAVYTQRIKLFEMVGKSFKDLGVSNLFVKPLASGKHQLLVRADNSLGTILVNLILNSSVLVKQNKPTNIFITVPPSENKQPTTYLLRVKDATQGNELLKEIEKYKAL